MKYSYAWRFSDCDESAAIRSLYKLITEDAVDIVVGPSCGLAATLAASICAHYNRLLVSWAAVTPEMEDAQRQRYTTVLSITDSPRRLIEAIEAFITETGWQRATIVYSDYPDEVPVNERFVEQMLEKFAIRVPPIYIPETLQVRGVDAYDLEMFMNRTTTQSRGGGTFNSETIDFQFSSWSCTTA